MYKLLALLIAVTCTAVTPSYGGTIVPSPLVDITNASIVQNVDHKWRRSYERRESRKYRSWRYYNRHYGSYEYRYEYRRRRSHDHHTHHYHPRNYNNDAATSAILGLSLGMIIGGALANQPAPPPTYRAQPYPYDCYVNNLWRGCGRLLGPAN